MHLKLITPVAAAILISTFSSARATSLSITTNTPTVNLGDTITLQIKMDFSTDPTLGGGFDIIFNPALVSYVANSYITDPTLGSDPAFTRDDNPAVTSPTHKVGIQTNRLTGAAFGSFTGLSGPATAGSLSFIADTAGPAVFSLGASTSASVGGFFSEVTFGEQFPSFSTTTVHISAVPIPAAAWLFGSGLLGLIGLARRQRSTA